MGKRRAVLGIDLGTSQVKALVMTPGGEILGRGRAGYRVVSPGEGLAETDPAEWWRATVAAVREALADASADVEVAAVGVDGQMHGVVLAGATGTPSGRPSCGSIGAPRRRPRGTGSCPRS